jgi:GTPase SAR1 family protein
MFLKEFNTLFDDKDVIYNSDKLGKLPLVIFGLSGSGKSTLLDNLIYFISEKTNKKFLTIEVDEIFDELVNDGKEANSAEVLELFNKYLTGINKKNSEYCIIEGLQISWLCNEELWENPKFKKLASKNKDVIFSFPTIVLGTSLLKSSLRAFFRNLVSKSNIIAFYSHNIQQLNTHKNFLNSLKDNSTKTELFSEDLIIEKYN